MVRGDVAAEIRGFLCSLPLFSDIRECSVILLAHTSHFRGISKGEMLFSCSDEAESAFVVRAGLVSIRVNSPDGREMEIDEISAGETFGELELQTGTTRGACAIARTNGEVLVIPGETWLRLMDDEPRFTRLVLGIISQRLEQSTNRLMALAFMNAQARLARYLLAMQEQERQVGYVTVSQDELARGSGLIRQTVAKALGNWRRNGWLLTGRGRIVILNRKALEQVEIGLLN